MQHEENDTRTNRVVRFKYKIILLCRMGKVDLYQRELPKYEGRLVQAWHTYEIVFGFLELSEQKPKVDATLYSTLDQEQSQRLGYETNLFLMKTLF